MWTVYSSVIDAGKEERIVGFLFVFFFMRRGCIGKCGQQIHFYSKSSYFSTPRRKAGCPLSVRRWLPAGAGLPRAEDPGVRACSFSAAAQ